MKTTIFSTDVHSPSTRRMVALSDHYWSVVLVILLAMLMKWCPQDAMAQPTFYGTTVEGGKDGLGTIYKFLPNGEGVSTIYEFTTPTPGANPGPGNLLVASNGKLYGVTRAGGMKSKGVLFEYEPATNTYTKKHEFGGNDGANPLGGLVEVNGKLYGVAASGSTNDAGLLLSLIHISNNLHGKRNANPPLPKL